MPDSNSKGVDLLVHCRSWSYSFFRDIVSEIGPTSVRYISERPFGTVSGPLIRRRKFHESPSQTLHTIESACIKKKSIDEIICRDRLLRSIPIEQALSRVIQAVNFYRPYFETASALIGISVDSYHGHIMHLMSQHYGVNELRLSSSFLDNFTFITSVGECSIISYYSQSANPIIDNSSYVPSYMDHFRSNNKAAFKRYLRSVLRILINKYLRSELFRYEYFHIETSRVARWPYFPLSTYQAGLIRSIDALTPVMQSSSSCLYIPIQLYPEHNTDYWLPTRYIPYDEKIIAVIRHIVSHGLFDRIIIKDHPALRGSRPRWFHQSIHKLTKEYSNIYHIDSRISQSDLLNRFRPTVFSLNSSAGHEAVLRGLPVFTHDSSQLAFVFSKLLNISPLSSLDDEEYSDILLYAPCHDGERYMKALERLHIKGYCNEVYYDSSRSSDRGKVRVIGSELKRLLSDKAGAVN